MSSGTELTGASTVSTIVSDQISAVRQYANTAFDLAQGYIEDLGDYVVGTIGMTPPDINFSIPTSVTVDELLAEQIPAVPEKSDFPTAPVAPTTSDYSFPGIPSYTLPDVPTLHDIVLPDFIEETIEQPSMSLPVMDFDVPSLSQMNDGGLAPEDSLVQAAKNKLLNNISDGGTMLNSQVEDDIWKRDLERNEQALQDQIDKITRQWARLGWSAPDGALVGAIAPVHVEYMGKRLDRSREIAVKQAEMEQAGMFKSLELAVSLENLLIGNVNDYAKRVFEASKTTVDATIEIFKERVNRYNSLLSAFKADADIYRIRIEAEMRKTEVYKARLQGQQLIADIDETAIKIYTAKIGAIAQTIDVYKTNVQAVATMYEAERQKIDMYKSKIDAYSSEIKAVTDKYTAQVEGFKAYLGAWSASADSQTKLNDLNIRAQIANAEATLKEWEIQLKLVEENTTLKLEALRAVAQTASNLAAGALSAGHASASASFSGIDQLNTSG